MTEPFDPTDGHEDDVDSEDYVDPEEFEPAPEQEDD